MMQVKQTWDCSECRFATMFEWELLEHLKATGHRKRRFFTPFSRWAIRAWIEASTGRRIFVSIVFVTYVVLLVMFIESAGPITVVCGLFIWIALKARVNFSKDSRTRSDDD